MHVSRVCSTLFFLAVLSAGASASAAGGPFERVRGLVERPLVVSTGTGWCEVPRPEP